jgi:hypothetical protein
MLFYPDQSEVCLGDRVLHNRDRAVVEALIEGDELVDGPTGSVTGPFEYLLSYQSEHHSHTDP